jgi:hypothetical protein
MNLMKQKGALNITISLGYFIFSKNHNEPVKVAQLVQSCPIWSPCLGRRSKLKKSAESPKINRVFVRPQITDFDNFMPFQFFDTFLTNLFKTYGEMLDRHTEQGAGSREHRTRSSDEGAIRGDRGEGVK